MPEACADPWNPTLYGCFSDERSQPFYDLLAMVDRPLARAGAAAAQAVDLGCGTGELTRALFDALRGSGQDLLLVLALDSSAAMLAQSTAYATAGLEFQLAAIESFAYGGAWPNSETSQGWANGWSLIFSNAALQWAEDHAHLFPALCAKLAPGGQLAVQMPYNDDHPAFRLAGAVAALPQFARPLGGYVRQSPVQPPEWYASLLYAQGLARINVRLQVFAHELAQPELVAQWVKGTLLNSYTRRLDEVAAAEFLYEYEQRLSSVLGNTKPYLFTFKRIFIYGTRPG